MTTDNTEARCVKCGHKNCTFLCKVCGGNCVFPNTQTQDDSVNENPELSSVSTETLQGDGVAGQPSIDFSCRVCGIQCPIAPDPPDRAVCPEHCEDDDYRYERELRGHYCFHCGEEAPQDWSDD